MNNSVPVFADYPFDTVVFDSYEEKMLEKKVELPVFPHWIHRILFKCKVCHERLFVMKNGSNDITMNKIDNGNMCGACHNGKLAFSPKDNCERCHQYNPSEKSKELVKFKDPKNIPFEEFKAIAKKLNIKWNAKAIKKNGLPFGTLNRIDFIKLQLKDMLITPRNYITYYENETIKEDVIVFRTKSKFQPNVPFSHTVHTRLLNCPSCHLRLFSFKLGGTDFVMQDMAEEREGKFCAYCHKDVAFPLLVCVNCHYLEKGKAPDFREKIILRNPSR